MFKKAHKRVIGTATGGIIGAILGAGTGIVGLLGGIAGWPVFAILFAIIGFFSVPDLSRISHRIKSLFSRK